jgi:protein-disulfide isomerase
MTRRVLIVAVMLGLAGATPLWAQAPPGAPGELGAVKADLERIKADLEDVKRQLAEVLRLMTTRAAQGPPTAPAGPVRASLGDVPALGRPTAPVTLVEFSDYQCPFCQRFFLATLPALKKEYIDTGKVRYVFRDFPLDQIHPQARKAAEAAHCAGEQGKYWEMHDVLFGNQQALEPPKLSEHARALGLDGARFDQCLASGTHAARVAQGLTDGQATGVQGTPGFVVAKTTPGDTVEGTLVVGAQPVEVFRRLIDQLLAEK